LKYISTEYVPVSATGPPVPLKISTALLFEEPSTYSEGAR
jgi:hypothetical protein